MESRLEKELQNLGFELTFYNKNIDNCRPLVYCYLNKHTYLIDYVGSTGNMQRRIYQRVYKPQICFDKYYRKHRDIYDLFIIKRCNTRRDAYYFEKNLYIG